MPNNSKPYHHSKPFKKQLIALIVALSTLISTQASAFTANSNQPIKIQSDRAELDEKKGRSIYSGDVVITQGKSILKSDKVIIYSDKSGLIKLEAFGSPAEFSDQQEGEELPTHAYGNTIIYTRNNEKLTLIDDAKLEQGKNTFRGKKIEYNTVSRVVTAQGGEEKSQRVEIIVHPVEKDSDEEK
ncbi:lipopolysaccharide transport periplasmic protein LptA [Alkalimarinus coralli]|uniref:lipopolysaccharide transport periplasmic protein LptA n=1 Tax=Alkalimarinus coralli TaxID=2935863 RepID=UPI00202B5415|nr:lipopolysaccharide transport periplasmic protein LptA [Alkalimarinus coralli]